VTIAGTGNRIEIWSRSRWEELAGSMSDDLISQAARELGVG